MTSTRRDRKSISGPGTKALKADTMRDTPEPEGANPRRGSARAQAKTGPRINLTVADPGRVKVVRKPQTPIPPADQARGAGPGFDRPACGSGRPQSSRSALVWKSVAPDRLHSSWLRPRASYDEGTIRNFAASLAATGWQHPILVRPHPVIPRDYEVVVGELPAQAARCAGLDEVTVVVCRLSDRRVLECMLLEDVRRPDLTPFEVAVGYGQLIRTFHYSLPALAKLVGKSERQVVRTLLLLDSPKAARDARENSETAPEAGRSSTAESGAAGPGVTSSADGAENPGGPVLSEEMAALERHLSRALGLKVGVSAKAGEGNLRISYANIDQLEWLVRHLLSMGVHGEPEPTCPGLAA